VAPALRSRLAIAVSSQRPATLTQQATQKLLREVVERTLRAPAPDPLR